MNEHTFIFKPEVSPISFVYVLESETPNHHEDPGLEGVFASLESAMYVCELGDEECRDKHGPDYELAWKRLPGHQIWNASGDLYSYRITRMEVKP